MYNNNNTDNNIINHDKILKVRPYNFDSNLKILKIFILHPILIYFRLL